MPEPLHKSPTSDPALRPSRISGMGQVWIALLLLASFVSGVMVWWGKHIQLEESLTPPWLHGTLMVHGSLNPFLCVLFGYLLCQHIRIGWQMRANLISGLIMEAAFVGLILTGTGLYYAGSMEWRENLTLAHRVLGLMLPAGLAAHWITGLRWAKKAARTAREQANTAVEHDK